MGSKRCALLTIELKPPTTVGGGGGGVYSIFMHGRSRMTVGYRPSHSYNAGTGGGGEDPA